jgi:hypothetical protein
MFEAARLADSAGDATDGGWAAAAHAASSDRVKVVAAPPAVNPVTAVGGVGRVPDRRSRRGRLSSIESPDSTPGSVPPNPAPAALSIEAEHPRIFPRATLVAGVPAIDARRSLPGDETLRHGTLAARAPLYQAPPANASSPRMGSMPAVSRTSPEPVVHVSIGRIELRATAPSKPVRRQDAPQGTSLDDYLRQRGDRARP